MVVQSNFREVIGTSLGVEFYYFTTVLLAKRNVFLIDEDDSVKNKLCSDAPNTFTKMVDQGYTFFFIKDACKDAIEGTQLLKFGTKMFDFAIKGTNLHGKTQVYKSSNSLIVLSFSHVVRAFGVNSYTGMVEIDNPQVFHDVMDYIFVHHIEQRNVVGGSAVI